MIGFGFENDLSSAKKLVPCCTKIVCMWKRKRKKTVKLVVGILLRMQWFKLSRRRVAPLHVMVAVTTTTLCDITMLAITLACAHCQKYFSCLLQWLSSNTYLNINARGLIGFDLTNRPTLPCQIVPPTVLWPVLEFPPYVFYSTLGFTFFPP